VSQAPKRIVHRTLFGRKRISEAFLDPVQYGIASRKHRDLMAGIIRETELLKAGSPWKSPYRMWERGGNGKFAVGYSSRFQRR